jgi:predicted PurR-regulated permease PerM
MPSVSYRPDWQRALIVLSAAFLVYVIVEALYQARVIFIPLALAIFLTFVLSPLVTLLQRHGVWRKPAVIIVVACAVLIAGGVTWVIADQTTSLLQTMAQKENAERITAKVERIRGWIAGSGESELGQLIDDLEQAVTAPGERTINRGLGAIAGGPVYAVASRSTSSSRNGGSSGSPPPVVVTTQGPAWMAQIESLITPLAEVVGQLAFAFILLVFMLLKKEDMRNRVLRLVGQGKVTTATKAVDDASRRVSRYLLMQLTINAMFGVAACLGLYLIGVKYALLWGFVGFLMRYVPYAGTWLGLLPPTLYAFALMDELWQPLAVIALFLSLEAICNNIFEPWLYGTSLGMSEVAQLVAAGFWAYLWGPIGLILSGPLTTCLMVLGKYVPSLKFLDVLLGREPPLTPGIMVFQRLAARDEDEASRIVHEHAAEHEVAKVFDDVVREALTQTRIAVDEGDFDTEDEKYILQSLSEIIEDVGDEAIRRTANATTSIPPDERVRILACPAQGEADRVGLEMLGVLLKPELWEIQISSAATLTSELMNIVEEFKPSVVCIGSLPSGSLSHTRYLCKRLKRRFPDLKVVVGRWGQTEGLDEAKQTLIETGVDEVYHSFAEARQQLNSWLPVLQAQQMGDDVESQNKGKSDRTPELVGMERA